MEQTLEGSLLIGKWVAYSVTKEKISKGRILDKVEKKDKVDDNFTVTGYMVEDEESGDIVCVSYWRIIRVIPNHVGHLPGGYKRAV